jgi:thiol:disulfide interchange protein DsbC
MKVKKVVSGLLLCSVILAVSLFAFAGNAPDPCKNLSNESITKHLNLPDFVIASKRNVGDGLCEAVLRIKDDLLPVYVSDGFVIVGDMFKSRVHVTKEKVSELNAAIFKENRAVLDEVTAFTYTAAQVKSTLYYITDPDCPYCERAKLQMKQFADDNSVELKVIFFPLPMHPNAKDKAIKAICGRMKYQGYLDGKYDGEKCKEGEDKIEKSISIIEKLKVSGTPTFISGNGERVIGFIPEKLKEIL